MPQVEQPILHRNWNNLAQIIFNSFAGLGLKGSGTGFSAADLLRPGKVAQTGLDAGRPLLESISDMMGSSGAGSTGTRTCRGMPPETSASPLA